MQGIFQLLLFIPSLLYCLFYQQVNLLKNKYFPNIFLCKLQVSLIMSIDILHKHTLTRNMQCSLQRRSTSVYLVVGTTRFNKQIMPTEPARFIDGRLSSITDNLKSRINNNYYHVKCLQTYGKGSCKL